MILDQVRIRVPSSSAKRAVMKILRESPLIEVAPSSPTILCVSVGYDSSMPGFGVHSFESLHNYVSV